ncbi:MAG: hypothetical protein V3R89_05165 [Thermoanaerobaculia bacterium]
MVRWFLPTLPLLLFGLPWAPEAARAQEAAGVEETTAAETETLAAEIRQRFEWVPLRNGWLLRPLAGEVERAVEISDGEVSVEGRPASADELREMLGHDDAELVLGFLHLDEAERSRLLESVGAVSDSQETQPESREKRKRRRRYRKSDTQITVGSPLTVEEDETAEDVVVFGAPIKIHGEVTGDAVAILGSITVSGRVTGDVAAVGGSVYLEPGAEVVGEVVSVGGHVEGQEEAKVLGEIVEVPFGPSFRIGGWPKLWGPGWGHRDWEFSPMGLAWDVVWWVFRSVLLVLLAFLVLLLARTPLERVGRRVTSEPWKAGLVGLVTQILFVPLLIMVVIILCVSIIGIPLLILVPFAVVGLILVAFLGYCAVALRLGRVLEDRFGWSLGNPYLVLLLGIALVQIWSLMGDLFDLGWGPLGLIAAMFLIFGVLVKYAVWTVGLGAGLLTRFGTAEGWGGEPQPSLPEASGPSVGQQGEVPTAPPEASDEGEGAAPDTEPDDWAGDEPRN